MIVFCTDGLWLTIMSVELVSIVEYFCTSCRLQYSKHSIIAALYPGICLGAVVLKASCL